MAQNQATENLRATRVRALLREPLAAAQERFEHLEVEAQRVLKDLVDMGRASRRDLEHVVERLSKQEWMSLPEMKQRIERLRDQGVERAAEWRGRAETFRAEAMERVTDLQSRAIAFLGVATRDQVEELSREIDRLAKRIDRSARARRGRKASSPEV